MTDYQLSRVADDGRVTNLLRDVAFNRHSMNDGHHVSPYDNGKIQVGTDGIVVKLTQGINEDNFKRTVSAAQRATIGVDLSEEDADFGDWEEMLQGGLQTALESQVIVFQVQGVSRTCTHQIVRTRNAAYHQQSQRASYYGGQPEARMPESVFLNPRARDAWIAAKIQSDRAYRIACQENISYQDARFVLLEGTDNYIMCEYSLREFINVYAYRGCSMFSWEIVYVMREMRRLLIEAHPWLEPYIKISCEKTKRTCLTCIGKGWVRADNVHGEDACPECKGTGESKSCTFQGWEEVEGQCDFAWAKEGNRTFVSIAHGIKKRDGMKLATRPMKGCIRWLEGTEHGEHEWIGGEGLRWNCMGLQPAFKSTSEILDKEMRERANQPLPKRVPLGERVVVTAVGNGVVELATWEDDGGPCPIVLADIADADVLDEHPCGKSALAHKHSPHEWTDGGKKVWYCQGFPENAEDEDA